MLGEVRGGGGFGVRLGSRDFGFLEGGVRFVLIPAEIVLLGGDVGSGVIVAGKGEMVRGLGSISHG